MTCDLSVMGGVGAIGFAMLIVIGNLIVVPAGLPMIAADPASVSRFFSTKRGAVGVSTALIPAGWALASLFGAAALVAVERRADESATVWALAGLAGVLLQNATFVGVVAIRLALCRTRGEGAQTLWALHNAVFTLNGSFLALAMVGLSVGGYGADLVGGGHAAVGLVAAALQFTSATLAPLVVERGGRLGWIGLVGWLLWVVWLIWYGVAFLTGSGC